MGQDFLSQEEVDALLKGVTGELDEPEQSSDDGSGMSPETLARVFDPFFTTKEPGRGTGLGLATSYDIVTRHGGSISAQSDPGIGTVFTVELPLEPEFVEKPASAGRSGE